MEILSGLIATTVAVAAMAMVFTLLAPSAILALRPNWLRQRFMDPSEKGVAEPQKKLEATVQDAEKLGLARLGVRTEWAGPLKSGRKECCELSSGGLRVFASVGVLSRRKATPFLYFLTPFADGALVFTATSTAHLSTVADDFAYGSLKAAPAELLQLHRARVQLLLDGGHKISTEFDAPGRIEACRAFYAHPRIRARMKKTAWLIALQLGAVAACISLVLFSLLGN